jgi:hypothetical protein
MKLTTLSLAVLIGMSLGLVGCGSSTSTTAKHQPTVHAIERSTVVRNCGEAKETDEHTREAYRARPVRIATLQDKSNSSNSTRTTQLTADDFVVPINILRCTGGELSVGILDDTSNRSLVRLRIEMPPTAPTPPQASNVFVRANEGADYQRRLDEYNEDVGKWAAETDKRVKRFLAQVAELLKQPPTARRTSVWNAVARADLMLNESDGTWPQPTRRYAILNSDCAETAGTKPVVVKSGAQWIVVNGAGSVGVVAEALKPEQFENTAAAFQFIRAKELGGK